jgi:hypothetical protein
MTMFQQRLKLGFGGASYEDMTLHMGDIEQLKEQMRMIGGLLIWRMCCRQWKNESSFRLLLDRIPLGLLYK